MDTYYPVYFGKDQVGKVQVLKQGLYYRFICRCHLSGDVVCRLHVRCADKQESLGVVVPMDGGFGLDTRIPAKRFGEGPMQFELRPKQVEFMPKQVELLSKQEEGTQETFVPISPEEPFSYISRLKHEFLVRQAGKIGIFLTK